MTDTDNCMSVKLTSYIVDGIISDAGSIFKVRRRLTHKDKKQGNSIDPLEVIAELRVSLPDEYKCCYLVINKSINLLARDWEEILATVEAMLLPDQMTFMRFNADYVNGDLELKNAFEKFGYYQIMDENNTYEHERKQYKWMFVLICLGLPVGMFFSRIVGINPILGLCYGFCFGMAVGAFVDYNNAKKRQQLLLDRKSSQNN